MATTCCRERAVLVAVYAERPGRRRVPPSKIRQSHDQHHYHHFHHHASNSSGKRRGYNRRAELLNYARNLRASAEPAASSSLSSQPSSHTKHPPRVQIVAASRKQKLDSSPTCFCKWEFIMPSFLRSMTNFRTNKDKGKKKDRNSAYVTNKIKVLVKSLQKNGSFMSKLFAKLRTRRLEQNATKLLVANNTNPCNFSLLLGKIAYPCGN